MKKLLLYISLLYGLIGHSQQAGDVRTLTSGSGLNGIEKACTGFELSQGFEFDASEGQNLELCIDNMVCSPQEIYTGISSGQNYIVTMIPTTEMSSLKFDNGQIKADRTIDGNPNVMTSVQYFDGLGRPNQLVQMGITPQKKDLTSFQEYDAFARESESWLPIVTQGNGQYVPLSDIDRIKNKGRTDDYGDEEPYSELLYEASSLKRVIERANPGSGSGRSAITYLTNIGKTGTISGIADILVCARFTVGDGGTDLTLSYQGNYAWGTLHVTRMKDEDGNISYEFKDKLGQVVLTRQISNNLLHDTYYVYDSFGNLKAVFPPLASDMVYANTSELADNSTSRNTLMYLYQYDERNRCIKKKLPGCDWVEYKYDDADRLIFSQDGVQRVSDTSPESIWSIGRWIFNFYDALGRVVVTGECENVSTDGVVKSVYQSTGYDQYGGYKPSGIGFNHSKVFSVNYYDNYDFLERTGFSSCKYDNKSGYDTRFGSDLNKFAAKGLLTGQMTALLDGSGEFLYTAMYYDERGRVIQTKSTNHKGGLEKEYISYNFTGQPVKKLHEHTASSNAAITSELYTYTYDHAGRMTQTKHKLNNQTEVILAQNEYDEQGRLKSSKPAGVESLKVNYAYNIRSWITSMTSWRYQHYLDYTHSGNVSVQRWGIGGQERRYDFTYDGLSRLLRASYTGADWEDFDTFYSYDKNGNITRLERAAYNPFHNSSEYCDGMRLTYNGNQLKRVTDNGFKFLSSSAPEFKDYFDSDYEYGFNANGAMVKDLNKGINRIVYNTLNYPSRVEIKNPTGEGINEYVYSASGTKLKTTHRWNRYYSELPVIGSGVNETSLTDVRETDYIGNKIYKNGSLEKILIDNGYIANGKYYFYQKDHLGNNRMVYDTEDIMPKEYTHYYPFGMSMSISQEGTNPFKFGDKELDKMHGLNQYDFHARQYDPPTARFTTVDPLAEKYYSISPYAYCLNNPMKFIDPTGKWIVGTDGKMVDFSPKTGWTNNTSVDVMIIGNSMMQSRTAKGQLDIMLRSNKEINIQLSPDSKIEGESLIMGRTYEKVHVNDDEMTTSHDMIIYQGSIEKAINMTDTQAEQAGTIGKKYQGLDITEGIAAIGAHEAVHTQQNNITENTNKNFDPEKKPRQIENKVLDELRKNK